MLRITLESQTPAATALKVEGWLTGMEVTLLEREGNRHLRHSQCLVLDISGVKFIDDVGLSLLKSWSGDHLVLRSATTYMRALLTASGLQSTDENEP